MLWVRVCLLAFASAAWAGASTLRAETVALWTFDEPTSSQRGDHIRDASGRGNDLELGAGTIVENGKFGRAIACPWNAPDFAARRLGVQGRRLNLGNFDWTVEWWQRRTGPVAEGHVDWGFMVCDQAANLDSSQWEAGYQAEVRFLGAGLWRHDRAKSTDGEPVYWNCFVDKYDEVARIAFAQDVQPRFYRGEDNEYYHVAWVYDARIKRLMYFEDGQGPFYIRDGAPVTPGNQTHAVYGLIGTGVLSEYPEEYADYAQFGDIAFYVGGQGEGRGGSTARIGIRKTPPGYDIASRAQTNSTAATLIDEMRVSDEVRYREPFSPPGSFAHTERKRTARLELNARRLRFVAPDRSKRPPPQQISATLQLADVGQGTATDPKKPKLVAESNVDWLRVVATESAERNAAAWWIHADPQRRETGLRRGKILIRPVDEVAHAQSVDVSLFVQPSDISTWLFDEPRNAPTRFQLEDKSPNGFDLQLGPGGALVEGKWGGGLRPGAVPRAYAAVRRYIDPSHLNLGAADWTFDGWFQLAQPVRGGEVLFELRENVAVGPYPHLDGVGKRTALLVADDRNDLLFACGRAEGARFRLAVPPNLLSGPASDWFHLSLSYNAKLGKLSHWINGELKSHVNINPPRPMPPTGENILAIGSAVSGEHAWPGVIDEVSISARARDADAFPLPESLAERRGVLKLAPGPHLFFDDYLVDAHRNLGHKMHAAEHPAAPPHDWRKFLDQLPNGGDVHLADLGGKANPRRRFLRYQYVHSYSEAEGQPGGIYCYYGPTRNGPWIAYEHNPVLSYVWAGQPHATYSVSDHWPVMFDDRTGQVVMIYKTYPLAGQHPVLDWYRDERFNYQNRVIAGFRRHQGIAFSDDGLHWHGHQQILVPDDGDEGEAQFQSPMLYRRGDLYIALAQVLRDDVDRSIAWISCATSRDLLHWRRRREPFIACADDPRRGDRWLHASGNTEIYADDRWMYFPLYVRGSHKPPRASFQTFARLPLDRFGSFDAVGEGAGSLVTPLLQLSTEVEELQLNCTTALEGELRVRALDEKGSPIRGYDFDDCEPIAGDELRRTVRWRNEKDLAPLREQPIRLEFSVHRGSLYAFYLIGGSWRGEKDYSAQSEPLSPADVADIQLTTAEVRKYLDLGAPADSPAAVMTKPAEIQAAYEIPPGFGYAGDPEPATLEIIARDSESSWNVVENVPWLSLSPREGRGTGKVMIRFHGTYLNRGNYLGKISIQLGSDNAARLDVPVCMQIR